jgi:hypothetical protein
MPQLAHLTNLCPSLDPALFREDTEDESTPVETLSVLTTF